MSNDFDIISIGSAAVDLFAEADSELIRIDSPNHHEALIAFPLGSKILIDELNIQIGGGGTNSATTFARLGLHTAYVGCIGNDANGQLIKEQLAQENITFIGKEEGTSGLSVVLNSFAKDRVILAYKGANNFLLPEDIPPFRTQWIYLSSMIGASLDTATQLIARTDANVTFNPSNYQAERGYQAMEELLQHVDLLIMNREEACKLMGLDPTKQQPIASLFQQLHTLPPARYGITDGANGAYIFDNNTLYHAKPSANIAVKETTGAGDAFASTLTAALAHNKNIETAMRWALANAESVLQYRGAKEKLLTYTELQTKLSTTNIVITQTPLTF